MRIEVGQYWHSNRNNKIVKITNKMVKHYLMDVKGYDNDMLEDLNTQGTISSNLLSIEEKAELINYYA